MLTLQRAMMLPPWVRRTFAEPGDGDGAGDGAGNADAMVEGSGVPRVAASSDDRTASTLPTPNALIAAVHRVQAPIAKTHRPPRMDAALPGAWESTPGQRGGPEGDLGRAGFETGTT